ncbi:MAG: hypothetical protein H0V87_03720 [Chloroflexi bacterium]|nr:hypothetical protein [Chloroflexota bacterium]
MSDPQEPKSEELRRLFWRDEILQLFFWLEGEGFGDLVGPRTLERFMGVDTEASVVHLEQLAEDGYLERGWLAYRLSERGRAEGSRIFAEEFRDWTRPAHGACGSDCWCQASRLEADACLAERSRTSLS